MIKIVFWKNSPKKVFTIPYALSICPDLSATLTSVQILSKNASLFFLHSLLIAFLRLLYFYLPRWSVAFLYLLLLSIISAMLSLIYSFLVAVFLSPNTSSAGVNRHCFMFSHLLTTLLFLVSLYSLMALFVFSLYVYQKASFLRFATWSDFFAVIFCITF